ncbi:WD40 repeat-like protein [Thozetella sp. PMI_491]|nr:WD40 repeat-like protein [Thozetella sp. PMI_491]
MDDYSQPDEGYSEDPLNPSTTSALFSSKARDDSLYGLSAGRPGDRFPAWLTQHIANLSVSDKTDLAMALLNDLPTSVISEIVQQLNPRLYIDFVRYLPPEVCLKILGYLDPVSLIHVARACRAWYDLALDRKLWQQLYYTEGWRARVDEIRSAERQMNERPTPNVSHLQRILSEDDGHARKKRAISLSPRLDSDVDMMDEADGGFKQEPVAMDVAESSIFGGGAPTAPFSRAQTGISQDMDNLGMHGSGSSSRSRTSGRAVSPAAPPQIVREDWEGRHQRSQTIAKSSLWTRDSTDEQSRLNWKYLYNLRRRLESNWELGKFTNFQLPHPEHPDEGHGECIYSLQYDAKYLVSGSRDRTLKVWNLATRRLVRTLKKHRGSVLCLQFDSDPAEDIIVSGSSDSDVVIWKFSTGEEIQTLTHAHRESVLNVKFDKRILVTCSKDKTIKIFNRRELRQGDMGYKEVDPVPRNVIKYGFDEPPVIPPFTMIGCLEGHSAAVNAVQIHDREVVSASGDRHIKVWDWPTQVCTRTIVGHHKGIACVQYDGRRIVSGSSDNEVKVFDRQTGLEVASLRSHSNLVRTVQVGFGDLPYSIEDDAAEAKRVDDEYFRALKSGQVDEPRQGDRRSRQTRRAGNAGSKRPEDITAYGAKLPPGGGGGKYGRIVSGSYDTTIIIWRRDKEGIWKAQHHLKQEDAAAAALRQSRGPAVPAIGTIPLHPSMRAGATAASAGGGPPPAGPAAQPLLPGVSSLVGPPSPVATNTSPRTQSASAPPASGRSTPPLTAAEVQATQVESPIFATLTPSSIQSYRQMVDIAVPAGPTTLAQTLATYPNVLTQRSYISSVIDREPSPFVRSQLRQVVGTAMIRTQFEQARQRREAMRSLEQPRENGTASGSGSSTTHAGPSTSQASAAAPSSASAGVPSGGAGNAGPPRPEAITAAGPSTVASHPVNIPPPTGATATAHAAALAAVRHPRSHQGLHLHQVSSPSPLAPAPAPALAPAEPSPTHHHPHQAASANAGHATQQPQAAHVPAPGAPPPPPPPPHVQLHRPRDAANPARVFKLQYDARRIICCSQTHVIVGWDFCNGDPELEEASRFFSAVQ